jgi:predicted negative regulator of RcsB-dependent stress response
MSQRLSRKEIKHEIRDDAFRHSVGASYDYVLGHQRTLILAIVGALLLAGAIAGYRVWSLRRERAAGELLGRATIVLEAPVVATGAKPDDLIAPSFPDDKSRDSRGKELLEQLRGEYPRSAAAEVAAVQLGRLRLDAGDVAGARELWLRFLEEREDHLLAGGVRVSLLDLDRRGGKAEQVATQLQTWLDAEDKPLPEDVLLYELAVTHEQLGRTEEARAAYQRIAAEYPDSPFASKASTRMRELGGGQEQAAPTFTVQPS